MNTLNHFDERWRIADLKPHVKAEFALGSLADFYHLQGAGYIYRDRFFKINVLAGSDYALQMSGMEIRRRGNYNRGHLFRGGNLFAGIRAQEELRLVHGRISFVLLHPVEVGSGSVELILKQVGQGNDATAAGVKKR